MFATINSKFRLALVSIGIASLASCGGGGDSAAPTAAVSPPPAGPPAAPTTAPITAVTPLPALSAKPTILSTLTTLGIPNWPKGDTASGGQGKPVAGLTCASSEAYHVHSHLTILKDGQPLAIPADIGIVPGCTYDLHTHDMTGIIHVESPAPARFTLGQFFAVWGQPLSASKVAGLIGQPINVYINDAAGFRQYIGDPGEIELTAHREITFVIGKAPSEIPTFTWDLY